MKFIQSRLKYNSLLSNFHFYFARNSTFEIIRRIHQILISCFIPRSQNIPNLNWDNLSFKILTFIWNNSRRSDPFFQNSNFLSCSTMKTHPNLVKYSSNNFPRFFPLSFCFARVKSAYLDGGKTRLSRWSKPRRRIERDTRAFSRVCRNILRHYSFQSLSLSRWKERESGCPLSTFVRPPFLLIRRPSVCLRNYSVFRCWPPFFLEDVTGYISSSARPIIINSN